VVDAGPDVRGTEGVPAVLTGSAADLGTATLRWVVPAGCTVADAAASTTVTCADDTTGSARLEAVDGTTVVASDTTPLAIVNAVPRVTIQPPDGGTTVAVGQQVTIAATVADVPADAVTVTIDAGDGSAAAPGTTRTVTWSRPGTYTVTVVAVDDDGGRATATVPFVVEDPATSIGARTWGVGIVKNGALAVWARSPAAPVGNVTGVVGGRVLDARVTGLSVAGATATVSATGRWGTTPGARVEVTVVDGGVRRGADTVRVVVKDGSGRVLVDTGTQPVIGTMTVRAS
jgi:hypothetical protein